MRDAGYEQKGLLRHRRERGDANHLQTHGQIGLCGGHRLVNNAPADTEIRTFKKDTVYVLDPNTPLERIYRLNQGHWQRWEIPVTPAHDPAHWMTVPNWSVPEVIIVLNTSYK